MSYSIISILALILNLIINREAFGNLINYSKDSNKERMVFFRYSHFLVIANFYFVTDLAWGLLYEHHESDTLFPFLYSDCVLYFLFMFMSMLAWMRYVVAYLDRHGRRSKILLYVVWSLFTLALINLCVNRFYPFIFSFNDKHEYVPESGRHIAFLLLVALYLVVSVYMLLIGHKAPHRERIRYNAVGLTCLVMELFLIMQIFDPQYPFYAMGLIIGICVIHSFVEAYELKEKEVYDHIATSLAEDYDAMYYINIETGEYREFMTSRDYKSLNVKVFGQDFYSEAKANIDKCIHPDDREFAHEMYLKETMLKNLDGKNSYSYKYRLMVDNQPRYYRCTVMRATDDKHLVLCEKDIDDEITAENLRLEAQKKHVTFSQIAESLAVNYDVIYYVDAEDSSFVYFEFNNTDTKPVLIKNSEDFFEDSRINIYQIVHKSDRDLALGFFNRDYMITTLNDQKSASIEYRVIKGRVAHHVRTSVRKTGDGTHFIIGIENIDDEIKKEKEHLKALNTEKELARRDELTGVKNKTAYKELEKSVQANIDNGMDYLPFAIIVCDANNLKKINDTQGHVAGDEYINNSAMLLCHIFEHSPVFRVGGDEFVVFLRGNDYSNRVDLMNKLRGQVIDNLQSGEGPILASGMAAYAPESDTMVSEIFDRADKAMYENKMNLKKEDTR